MPRYPASGVSTPRPVPAFAEDIERFQTQALVVRAPAAPWRLPQECACCGAAASQKLRAATPLRSVLVPYCDECFRHASAVKTRLFALTMTSVVLGVSIISSLPLLELGWPWVYIVGLALLGSLAPLALRWLWKRRVTLPHTSGGLAAAFTLLGDLVCARQAFAERTAELNGVELGVTSRWPELRSLVFLLGPSCVLLLALPLFFFHTAPLRLLNLTDQTFYLLVDQRLRATLRPTSNESPIAGRKLRVSTGARTVTVVSYDGSVLSEEVLSFSSRHEHLFAPGEHDQCFWIETTSYGRDGRPMLRHSLQSGRNFWALQVPIDSWFAPSPQALEEDKRSSGGQMSAVRHGPCTSP